MRVALIAGSTFAAVVALVVLAGLGRLGGGGGGGSLAPTRALTVRTSLSPQETFFGDVVTATVDVTLDPGRVRSGDVRIDAVFDPYVQTARPAVTHRRLGPAETILYRYRLQCVSDGCLPSAGTRTVQLAAVTATAGHARATASWPALAVAPRVAAQALRGTPRFRRSAAPPPASFGLPAVAANLLTAAAGLLALGACALLALELRALLARRRAARRPLTPRELAVVYARQAAGRTDPADRRRALGLLSSAVRGEDGRLAVEAGDAAWAEQPPSPDRTLELAEEAQA